ncbi:hypothetical protein OCA8868_00959 [Octadecabacter ascidiaceicola]|uniref:DUF817 domain-containing protein n=2 Tax=Octadecabacter ascidiaceicola TaxID=1655543 RepID=A0A238JS19_9RHOB|nr:hypothetical protein OCA8868_00959 [Octadecabacter ascidiaceicola]
MDILGGFGFSSAMTAPSTFETRIERPVRARLPARAAGPVLFVLKHAWACLFAGLILIAVIVTKAVWSSDWPINRYDALFGFALAMQVAMLVFKLETWQEAKVIALFHLTGTAMEWFKVSAGSWAYPEDAIFMILGVPMFSGFMYASVGSYIARVIRLFDLRFTPYPPFWMTVVLAVAIYVNFFAHHFVPDIRLLLFAATAVLFWRTRVVFELGRTYAIPLPLAVLFASFFLWIAENVGTLTGTWVYAGSAAFEMTSFSKMGSWYLLLYVAFVTVTVVERSPLDIKRSRATPSRR